MSLSTRFCKLLLTITCPSFSLYPHRVIHNMMCCIIWYNSIKCVIPCIYMLGFYWYLLYKNKIIQYTVSASCFP